MGSWIQLCFIVILLFLMLISTVVSKDCCNRCWSDCEAYLDAGHTTSGVYHVYPEGMRTGYDVYCDMTTDGGGWTVFQQRIDGTIDFNRDWEAYERGFGNISHEHWLGLNPLERISSQGRYMLRVDIGDWEGVTAYATYDEFKIGPSVDDYRLTIGLFNGNIGDSMKRQNRQAFSTRDRDNDIHADKCTDIFRGGWWFEECCHSNLNGVYKELQDGERDGVFWYHWKNNYYSLKSVQMKMRRA